MDEFGWRYLDLGKDIWHTLKQQRKLGQVQYNPAEEEMTIRGFKYWGLVLSCLYMAGWSVFHDWLLIDADNEDDDEDDDDDEEDL